MKKLGLSLLTAIVLVGCSSTTTSGSDTVTTNTQPNATVTPVEETEKITTRTFQTDLDSDYTFEIAVTGDEVNDRVNSIVYTYTMDNYFANLDEESLQQSLDELKTTYKDTMGIDESKVDIEIKDDVMIVKFHFDAKEDSEALVDELGFPQEEVNGETVFSYEEVVAYMLASELIEITE